jgi:hypothetical protein
MKKIMCKVLKFVISRGIYIVLGAIIALTYCQGMPQEQERDDYHDFIMPDLREASTCTDFYKGEEEIVGHVCSFEESGYVYLYLPVVLYVQHLIEACGLATEEEIKQEEKKQAGDVFLTGGFMNDSYSEADLQRACEDPWSNRKILF